MAKKAKTKSPNALQRWALQFAGKVDKRLLLDMTNDNGQVAPWSTKAEQEHIIRYAVKALAAGALGQAYYVCSALFKLFPPHDCVESWPMRTIGGKLFVLVEKRDQDEDLLYGGQWCAPGSAPMARNFFMEGQPEDVMNMYLAVRQSTEQDRIVWQAGSPVFSILMRTWSRELGMDKQYVLNNIIPRAKCAGAISQNTPRGGEGARLWYVVLTEEEANKVPLTSKTEKAWIDAEILLSGGGNFIEHQKVRLLAMIRHMETGAQTM